MAVGPLSDYFSKATWELIEHKFSPEAKTILNTLLAFGAFCFELSLGSSEPDAPHLLAVIEDCIPAEEKFHEQVSEDPKARWASYPSVIEELKAKAKKLGLFNLFLSVSQLVPS